VGRRKSANKPKRKQIVIKVNDTKDKPLTRLLNCWNPEAQLSPDFSDAVWKRIESAEPAGLWRLLVARIEAALTRPALATAYIVLLLLAGIGAGLWRAEDRAAQANSELRSRYVQSIDPYQMPR
jgi:hypothetical protein